MSNGVSVCVTAGNEEQNIRRCLESVRWADEIIVVDSFSKDRTVEIAREYSDRVYQHQWLGYIGQKNLIKDMATGPWIFFVDADEEVSPELRDEIIRELASDGASNYAGYEFPRMVKYLGRWIRHGDWYPDIKLRLFRKEMGQCTGKEPHDRVEVDGKVKRLRNHLYHYTYNSVTDQVDTLNRFSSITARGWHEEGKRCHVYHLFFRPAFKFLRSYFIRMGFLDGVQGFIIASMTSFGVMIKFAKLWQFNHTDSKEAIKPNYSGQ